MTEHPETEPPGAVITASAGLVHWMAQTGNSFAFTSYQTGQLFLVGVRSDGSLSVNQQNYVRAMGLAVDGPRLHLASQYQVWTLANMLAPGQIANDEFDVAFVPRHAHTTGDIDAHELAIAGDGRSIFVNARYNCLATLDPACSFRAIWKPDFIDAIVGEDRCHLNGLAICGTRALVTLSKPRDGSFGGLALDGELARRGMTAWCGVVLVDLVSGKGAEWLRIEGRINELFDVVLLPGVRCPMSLGIDSDEIRATITHSSALPPDTDQKAPG